MRILGWIASPSTSLDEIFFLLSLSIWSTFKMNALRASEALPLPCADCGAPRCR
jgi:hypothetical protein